MLIIFTFSIVNNLALADENSPAPSSSSPVLVNQPGAPGGCRDFVIQFVENNSAHFYMPNPYGRDGKPSDIKVEEEWNPEWGPKESARQVTAVFKCNGGNLSIPSVTSIHFIETNEDGETCFSERSCGNVKNWKGYFSTSVGYSAFTSTSEFFGTASSGSINTEYSSYGIFARFSLNWKHFQHYCKEASEKICMGGNRK